MDSPRQDLIDWVNSHCVLVEEDRFEQLPHMHTWCEHMVGEQRLHHPIWEAMQGWIDYVEGDWACTGWRNRVSFWFARKSDAMAFELAWS